MPQVVIVGGGFGGLYAAQAAAKYPLQITVVDRENHHLFQPLLYQVATAALSPGAEFRRPVFWTHSGHEASAVARALDRARARAPRVVGGSAARRRDREFLPPGHRLRPAAGVMNDGRAATLHCSQWD